VQDKSSMMKLWQIKNVLSDEMDIYNKYFLSFYDNQQDISSELVVEALTDSKKLFLVTDKGYLRLNLSNDKSSKVIDTLSAVKTYKTYGGNAINEVIDYGSCFVGENKKAK
jgi:hypothetical protein